MKKVLVSVIITTRNEERNIENCIQSILKQTYSPIQIIVVDNNSLDNTKKIAKKFTKFVYDKGPERSAQRNFGAQKAEGEYLVFIDCDMILTPKVIEECVKTISDKVGGLVIPEESIGSGFWAKAKSLERSFYLGKDSIEAARFYPKKIITAVGGFDETLTGPEDWDLSQRVSHKYHLGRINAMILHNEGNLSLRTTIQKKYYYAHKFKEYLNKDEHISNTAQQFSIIGRYKIFFTQPKKLMKDPLLSAGMLFMKTSEFIAGGFGYVHSKIK